MLLSRYNAEVQGVLPHCSPDRKSMACKVKHRVVENSNQPKLQRKKSWYLVFFKTKRNPFSLSEKAPCASAKTPGCFELRTNASTNRLDSVTASEAEAEVEASNIFGCSLEKTCVDFLQIYCCPPSNLRFWCCELGRFLTKVKKKQSFDASRHMPVLYHKISKGTHFSCLGCPSFQE